MSARALILASASPRRRELLAQLGLNFRVLPSAFDEASEQVAAPHDLATALAVGKARAVAAGLQSGLVIGADTIVVRDDQVLGKPLDDVDAARMLELLSGGWHQVLTGIAVIDVASGDCRSAVESTGVRFRELTPDDITAYVASGEPQDKAGAYAIQGLASLFIEGIDGCYFNVVGLPLFRLGTLLREFGVEPLKTLSTTRLSG